jgi:TonB family protein
LAPSSSADTAIVPREKFAAPDGAGPANAWRACVFPAEADRAAIDNAYVVLRVSVSPAGTADIVDVLQDPGHGFGAAARECALKRKYLPALDAAGAPHADVIKIRIHFSR